MSRTRKTTSPPALGTLVARHDHSEGACDLPAMPRTKGELRALRGAWGVPLTRCMWNYPEREIHRMYDRDPWERAWAHGRKAKRLARWLAVDFDAQMEA